MLTSSLADLFATKAQSAERIYLNLPFRKNVHFSKRSSQSDELMKFWVAIFVEQEDDSMVIEIVT